GVEWQAVKTKGVYRRMIADNGKGMSPEELQEFFNCFGGGGKPIGDEHGNFGIGAKTALLPWNHHGVVVISWVDGQPAMIRIMRDETKGEYGLHIFEAEDDEGDEGREAVVEPYNDLEHGVDWCEVKPSWIDQHGTVIVLLGNHPDDDTFRGDLSRDEDGTKDIAQSKITITSTGCSGFLRMRCAVICGWSCGRPSSTGKPRAAFIRAPRATRCNGLEAASCRCRIGANSSPTSCQRP